MYEPENGEQGTLQGLDALVRVVRANGGVGEHTLRYLGCDFESDGQWLSLVCGCGRSSDIPCYDRTGLAAQAIVALALSSPEAYGLAVAALGTP